MDIQVGDLYKRTINESLALVTAIDYDEEEETHVIRFSVLDKPDLSDLIFTHDDFLDHFEPAG